MTLAAPLLEASHESGTGSALFMLLAGTPRTLASVVLVILTASVLGVTLGVPAGRRVPFWDAILCRLVELRAALPVVVLVPLLVARVPSFLGIALCLGLSRGVHLAKLLRNELLELDMDRALAAEAAGIPRPSIVARLLLPQTLHVAASSLIFAVPAVITAEAALVALHLAPSGAPSWGAALVTGQGSVTAVVLCCLCLLALTWVVHRTLSRYADRLQALAGFATRAAGTSGRKKRALARTFKQ